MAKTVDPDQTAPQEQSDQGLQLLVGLFCLNILESTKALDKAYNLNRFITCVASTIYFVDGEFCQ